MPPSDTKEGEKFRLYSEDVEIGQLSEPPMASDSDIRESACLAWLEPEEIFAMDTDIFRGTVEDLYYYTTEGGYEHYFTVAKVAVSEVYALRSGSLSPGDVCTLYLPVAPGFSTSISGNLEHLQIGSEAIFMPYATSADTGIRSGESYFCYADVADYYFSEGTRFLFLDTGRGLSFERSVYSEIADALTLDEIAEYIQRMLLNEETDSQTDEAEANTSSFAPSAAASVSIVSQNSPYVPQQIMCSGVPLAHTD